MHKNRPESLITVAVPLYNGEKYIATALNALFAQTEQRFDLIICDDGCTDRSLEIIRALPYQERIKIYRNDPPPGLVSNWNACAARVTTKYFTLLHQDDAYEPEFLQRMLAALEAQTEISIMFSERQLMDAQGNRIDDKKANFRKNYLNAMQGKELMVWQPAELARVLIRGNLLCCPTAVYRTAAFRRLGSFSADYSFVPDWEYWLRACFNNERLAIINDKLFRYRIHEKSTTTQKKRDFLKYFERQKLLDWAVGEALSRQWITTEDCRKSAQLSQRILLWDMVEDLAAGDVEEFARKYRYGLETMPGFRKDWMTFVVATLAKMGPSAGRTILQVGNRLAQWIA